MRYCPLIGANDCREDCIFRTDMENVGLPSNTGGTPNVFEKTWGTPQSQCGLLVALTVCAEIAWLTAGQHSIDLQRAIETARRVGFDRFVNEIKEESEKDPDSTGPSPLFGAFARTRAILASLRRDSKPPTDAD